MSTIRAYPWGEGDPISKNVWHINNIGGDIAFECFHFVFWSMILALIESGVFKKIQCKRNVKVNSLTLNLDEDVIAE